MCVDCLIVRDTIPILTNLITTERARIREAVEKAKPVDCHDFCETGNECHSCRAYTKVLAIIDSKPTKEGEPKGISKD